MTDDDDLLMRRYARGEAQAFDQLYGRHRAALYRFVRRLLGVPNVAQVDEVFQDTWLRVVRSRHDWQPQGASFRTWLFTLAHHRAIDCLRKTGREVSLDDDASDAPSADGEPWQHWPLPADDDPGPDEQAFWRAAGQRLLHCLEGLPLAQRSVFLLHHEDGLSLDDLARSLDVGFETVKSRLRYAMSKLRGCMGAYLPAGDAR